MAPLNLGEPASSIRKLHIGFSLRRSPSRGGEGTMPSRQLNQVTLMDVCRAPSGQREPTATNVTSTVSPRREANLAFWTSGQRAERANFTATLRRLRPPTETTTTTVRPFHRDSKPSRHLFRPVGNAAANRHPGAPFCATKSCLLPVMAGDRGAEGTGLGSLGRRICKHSVDHGLPSPLLGRRPDAQGLSVTESS